MSFAPPAKIDHRARLSGLLIGGAVGDALGLPAEGISPERLRKWWPGPVRHRFLFGRGMISDDTEHAFLTAQALLKAGGDVERFRQSLAWKIRWWFVALPAGVGFATARACIRLWLGVSPEKAGVHSAGNGPAMRSAIIGAAWCQDPVRRRSFVEASTRLTHRDQRAETAALAVAEAAAIGIAEGSISNDAILQRLRGLGKADDVDWATLCARIETALADGTAVGDFVSLLGLERGVTGYAYHSVPIALFAWLRHRGDFPKTLEGVIRCGGDTDTVAAIAGALAGCDVGIGGIPADWRNGLRDFPISTAVLGRAGNELASDFGRPVSWAWFAVGPRNVFFLLVVLAHGFRRLLPPY